MPNYEDDLREERQLNELLKAKLRQSDERIATLTALANGKRDPFRDLLLKELGVDHGRPEVATAFPTNWTRTSISEELKKILIFIGAKEVSLNELSPFIAKENISAGKDARRAMFDFKKSGLLENPRRGFYKLSEAGLRALNTTAGEDKLA